MRNMTSQSFFGQRRNTGAINYVFMYAFYN